MVISGNICTLYLLLNNQASFLSTDFMGVGTNSTVSSAAVDGGIQIVKIKSAGSGATGKQHTYSIAIRGDGTGGLVSVTTAAGSVSAVSVTNIGSGYTFGYIRNADIVAAGASDLAGAELDCYN